MSSSAEHNILFPKNAISSQLMRLNTVYRESHRILFIRCKIFEQIENPTMSFLSKLGVVIRCFSSTKERISHRFWEIIATLASNH